MADLVNNTVPLFISSRDRIDITDSTTDFTIALKKSLRNIAALNVAGVVIPRSDTLIGPNNDTLTGAIIVDSSINLFSVSITRTNYTAATLATELQTKLNANTDMLALAITFVVSYSSTTNRMTITATYPLGATHTWGIQIDFTPLRDIIGIGIAGTTTQQFNSVAAATTLDISCTRAPQLIRALSYNITSSALTNSINTSYISSLGKQFTVESKNDTLTIESQITTSAHATLIGPPSDPLPSDQFRLGSKVSITNIGNIMAVNSRRQGAYLFSRSSVTSAWVQVDNPIRDESYMYGNQGETVSISGDGTTLAFGAYERFYVYIKSGARWVEQTKVLLPGVIGVHVNLNIDGSTLAIGATNAAPTNLVSIYHRTGGTWSLQQTLPVPGGSVGFGSAGVFLSNTGDNLVTGDAAFGSVVAYVYLRTAGVWALQQTIVPGTAVGGFIDEVSIAGNGNYLALSSSTDNVGVGATWMYNWTGATWNEQQKIVVTSGSTALNIAGDTVIIGAPAANGAVGYVHVWKRTGAVWAAQLTNFVGTGAVGASRIGAGVAITGAGDDVIYGGPADDSKQGAVWSSHRTGATWAQVLTKVTNNNGEVIELMGAIVSLSDDGTTVAVGFPAFNSNSGAVYIYKSNGLSWDIQEDIFPTIAAGVPLFGTSVSLSGDGNTVIIGGPNTASPADGAAWIYTRSGSTWAFKAFLANSADTQQGSNVCISGLGTTAVVSNNGANGFGIDIWYLVFDAWMLHASNLATGLAAAITRVDINTAGTSIVASSTSNGAVIFDLVGTTWTIRPNFLTLKSPAGAGSFGRSVAVSSDGLVVAVSDIADTGNIGATYMFRRASTSVAFAQEAKLVGTPNGGTPPQEGLVLALANNGATIIISSSIYDAVAGVTGGVWIFDYAGSWTQRPGVITGTGLRFGTDISAQKTGARYIVGQTNLGSSVQVGVVYEYSPAGSIYDITISVDIPNGPYSVFDIVNVLNELFTSSVAPNNGYVVAFDGVSRLTITSAIASPVTSNTLRVSTNSTFSIARWPNQDYKASQSSNPMDFSINNDVIKSIVNHSDNSDNVIVDNTPDITYRRYPAGYTIESGTPIDIQLRNNRDQIVDLNGADWIMTIYATVRS